MAFASSSRGGQRNPVSLDPTRAVRDKIGSVFPSALSNSQCQRRKYLSRITTLPLADSYGETVSDSPAVLTTAKPARDDLSDRRSKVSGGFIPIVHERGKRERFTKGCSTNSECAVSSRVC